MCRGWVITPLEMGPEGVGPEGVGMCSGVADMGQGCYSNASKNITFPCGR